MNGARLNDIHRERTKIADEWTTTEIVEALARSVAATNFVMINIITISFEIRTR